MKETSHPVADDKDVDNEDGSAGSSSSARSTSPEVAYSDGTSFAESSSESHTDHSDSCSEADGERKGGGRCEECDGGGEGRFDEDGGWYCKPCWAVWEGVDDGESESEGESEGAGEGAGDGSEERAVETGGAEGGSVASGVRLPRCTSCGITEAGGHECPNRNHYCDWCWIERGPQGAHVLGLENSDKEPDDHGADQLPIDHFREEIMHRIQHNSVTSILGETGCGKSSMVPQFILDECERNGRRARIFVTQPRRIAAITLARRVAQQRGEALGRSVGYRVGNHDHVESKRTQIVFCTVGYLLAFLSHNAEYFRKITHLVLDEVHERTVDSDMLSYIITRLMRVSSVKVVVMSATLQMDTFGSYFTPTAEPVQPPLFVGAKRFEVQRVFLDELCQAIPGVSGELVDKVAGAFMSANVAPKFTKEAKQLVVQCIEAVSAPGTSILVFLAGINEICEVEEEMQQRALLFDRAVHVLHSQVPQEDQDLALQPPPPSMCKVILTTNIAESSITIPEVEVVIDTGMVREMHYDERRRLSCLVTQWISRASSKQRAGRAGRVKEGLCISILPRHFHDRLKEFDDPEILRTSLSKTVLNIKLLFKDFGSPSQVLADFLSAPPPSRIKHAIEELCREGATTSSREDAEVTALGETATRLPVDLELCKLITLGTSMAATNVSVVVAAALSIQDVFSMPMAVFTSNADKFASELSNNIRSRVVFDSGCFSEPAMYLRVYMAWLSSPRSAAWCKKHNLNFRRMRQLDQMVATLAAGTEHIIKQQGLIPEMGERLVGAARSRDPLPGQEVEVIVLQGCTMHTIYFILAGAFSRNFFHGQVSCGAETLARESGFDPRKSVLISDFKPRDVSSKTIVAALQTLLEAINVDGSGAASNDACPSVPMRKSMRGAARSDNGSGRGAAHSDKGSGRAGRVTVAKSHETPGRQILLQLAGPEALGPCDADGSSGCIAEDASYPVKILLQLFKHNRGKIRLPNPKFVVGGSEPEHIDICQVRSSRTIDWQLGAYIKVITPSRQPAFQMSDFGREMPYSTRLSVAFSCRGTQNPESLAAEGLTVLPRGPFGSFLFVVFAASGADMGFFCSRDGDRSSKATSASDPAIHAALSQNVIVPVVDSFGLDSINFFRQIVSCSIAGRQISAQDRRRAKEILAGLMALGQGTGSEPPLPSGLEWRGCHLDTASSEYFPPLLLSTNQDRGLNESWPVLGHESVEHAAACAQGTGANQPQSSSSGRVLKELVAACHSFLIPLLNASRRALEDLNADVVSNRAVRKAAKRYEGLDGPEVCILGKYFEEKADAFVFALEVPAEGCRGRVVVSTHEFEEKRKEKEAEEVELLHEDGCFSAAEKGGNKALAVSAAALLQQLVRRSAAREDDDTQGLARSTGSNSKPFVTALGIEVVVQESDMHDASKTDGDHAAAPCDVAMPSSLQDEDDEQSAGVLEQDMMLRAQLSAATMLLGLSTQAQHPAPSPADMLQAFAASPLQESPRLDSGPSAGVAETRESAASPGASLPAESMPERLRVLEMALMAMLRAQGAEKLQLRLIYTPLQAEMTLAQVNERIRCDESLLPVCKELFCDYKAKHEARSVSGCKQAGRVPINPFTASGDILQVFFQNRKSIFHVETVTVIRGGGGKGQAQSSKRRSSSLVRIRLKAVPRCESPAAAGTVAEGVTETRAQISGPALVQLESEQSQPGAGRARKVEKRRSSNAEQGAGAALRTVVPSDASHLAAPLFHGIQLANGWQQWNAPDGRVYYFHPKGISQWEMPDDAGQGPGAEVEGRVGGGGRGSAERKVLVRKLESICVALLQSKEMEIAHINSKIAKHSDAQSILKELCDSPAQRSRKRDVGVDQGSLKANFFDKPETFETRRKGGRVFVRIVKSAVSSVDLEPRTAG